MYLSLLLATLATCTIQIEDAGSHARHGVRIRLQADETTEVSELRPVLQTERTIYLDPVWPKLKVLASRNTCYSRWNWPTSDELPSGRAIMVTPGEEYVLEVPVHDPDPRVLRGDPFGGWEPGEPFRCFYRLQIEYSLDPWLPGREPARTYKANSERFTLPCEPLIPTAKPEHLETVSSGHEFGRVSVGCSLGEVTFSGTLHSRRPGEKKQPLNVAAFSCHDPRGDRVDDCDIVLEDDGFFRGTIRVMDHTYITTKKNGKEKKRHTRGWALVVVSAPGCVEETVIADHRVKRHKIVLDCED